MFIIIINFPQWPIKADFGAVKSWNETEKIKDIAAHG